MPGKRCVMGGCRNHTSEGWPVVLWPKDENLSAVWNKFVKLTRRDWITNTSASCICCDHFAPDQFTNFNQWVNGFAGSLRKSSEATPSILYPKHDWYKKNLKRCHDESMEPSQPGASGDASPDVPLKMYTTEVDVATRALQKLEVCRMIIDHTTGGADTEDGESRSGVDVEIQTEPLISSSVACQAKLNPTKRSQGVQHHSVMKDTGTQTYPIKQLRDVGVQHEEEHEQVDSDPSYKPPSSFNKKTTAPQNRRERVYLVYVTQLLKLFALCFSCRCPADVKVTEEGTCAIVNQSCDKGHNHVWKSQPYIKKMACGNLITSASILISGVAISKTLRLFKFMNVAMVSASTFYRHQKNYLIPHVLKYWDEKRRALVEAARALPGGLVLQGDSRCDSPGHCAKFGTYTLMEANMKKVLAVSVVQCNEVGGSYHMELEGLKRSLQSLADLTIRKIVTDRHRSIAKWLREELPEVLHQYDVWHVSKGVRSKLESAAKQSGCELILYWKKSILNHLYWCAVSSNDNEGDLIRDKWLSCLKHIHNKHAGFDSKIYPKCEHAPISDSDDEESDWLEPGSKSSEKIENIVASKYLLKDMRQLSPDAQTSALEAFNSLMLVFVPKHTAYSFKGMKARSAVTALHHNENSERDFIRKNDDSIRYSVFFPKAKKGEASVRPIKSKPTYNYADELISTLLVAYETDLKSLKEYDDGDAPPCMAADYDRPSAEDVQAKLRFVE